MTYNINGHTVSTFYAGFINYVVDGITFYSVTQAAKACGLAGKNLNDCLWNVEHGRAWDAE